MPDEHQLTIVFDTVEMAKEFKQWMCGGGEQDYWAWMDEQAEEYTARWFYYSDDPNKVIATRRKRK